MGDYYILGDIDEFLSQENEHPRALNGWGERRGTTYTSSCASSSDRLAAPSAADGAAHGREKRLGRFFGIMRDDDIPKSMKSIWKHGTF